MIHRHLKTDLQTYNKDPINYKFIYSNARDYDEFRAENSYCNEELVQLNLDNHLQNSKTNKKEEQKQTYFTIKIKRENRHTHKVEPYWICCKYAELTVDKELWKTTFLNPLNRVMDFRAHAVATQKTTAKLFLSANIFTDENLITQSSLCDMLSDGMYLFILSYIIQNIK